MAPPEPLTPLADHTQLPVADFAANGVAILPDVLSGSEVAALRTACDSCLEQWKASSTAHNQPSAYCWGPEAWILLHLNHPDFFASDATRPFLPRILNAVASPAILSGLRKIFGVDDMGGPDCTIRQINYYIDPPRQGRPPNWHRDSQFFAGGDNELERRTIAEEANPTREVHVHIPLLPTTHSGFVPGSHLRWDTPEEHRVRMAVDAASGTRGCGEIQGGYELQLEPGDASIFHVNGLHRGRYDVGYMRRTIAITVGDNERPRLSTAASMIARKGYESTFQPWFLQPHYLDGCTPAARQYYTRFCEVFRANWAQGGELLAGLEPEMRRYFTLAHQLDPLPAAAAAAAAGTSAAAARL